MAKLTVQEIDALKPRSKAYKKSVDTGLLLRVSTSGVKTWIVQYVVHKKQTDFPLSKPWGKNSDEGHLSLADARHESSKIRAFARQGVDYRLHLLNESETLRSRDAKNAAIQQAIKTEADINKLTFEALFSAWLRDGVRRKDGNAELLRSFTKDVLPAIGEKTVRDVSEHDLRSLLRRMIDRGVNRLAVVTYNNLTQLYLWAEKRQPWRKLLVEGNPIQLVEIGKIVSPGYDLSNERGRLLSNGEITELHSVFRKMRDDYEIADDRRRATRPLRKTTELAISIMLSTLCRVGELSMARWEHIDLVKGEWFIPKANVKGNAFDFMVFLSEFALKKFKELREETGSSEWCYPSVKGTTHVCVKSISKQVGDRQVRFKRDCKGNARSRLKNRSKDEELLVLAGGTRGAWTPHDLRRTGATLMQSLGVQEAMIDRCQNHVLSGSKVRRHYQLYKYNKEKQEAWRLLGELLSALTQPGSEQQCTALIKEAQ